MKNVLCFIIAVSVGLSPRLTKAQHDVPIGIIGALDEEVASIQELIEHPEQHSVNGKTVFRGTIHHHSIVLVKSGVGKVNAAATTQLLISTFGVRGIIFTGVAGALNPSNRVGDVIIAKQLSQHDYGIVTPDGKMLWRAGTMFLSPSPKTTWFDLSHSYLFQQVKQAAKAIVLTPVPESIGNGKPYVPKIHIGTIVTGDEFIASEKKRQQLATTFKADAVEMEGAAFAQVCSNNHIDCVVIRTISDLANEYSHVDFVRFAAYAAHISAQLVEALFSQPYNEKGQ